MYVRNFKPLTSLSDLVWFLSDLVRVPSHDVLNVGPPFMYRSLAASAPIWQFTGITPCEAFNQVLTAGFARASNTCVSNIRNSWNIIDSTAESGTKNKRSRVVRKAAFCICENKDADQLCASLCFCYIDSTILLLPQFEVSSL